MRSMFGRAAHHAVRVGADVPHADVVAEDDEDVRLLAVLPCRVAAGIAGCGAGCLRSLLPPGRGVRPKVEWTGRDHTANHRPDGRRGEKRTISHDASSSGRDFADQGQLTISDLCPSADFMQWSAVRGQPKKNHRPMRRVRCRHVLPSFPRSSAMRYPQPSDEHPYENSFPRSSVGTSEHRVRLINQGRFQEKASEG